MYSATNNLIYENEVKIFGPELAGSLIKEIWQEQFYTKKYQIREGDTIVDIGANIGVFSLWAAKQGAKVFAIEPNPEAFYYLKKNIEENDFSQKITALNCAIGDSNGFIDLKIPDSDMIYSLGSATIMDNIKEYLSEKCDIKFKISRVEKISLSKFTEKYFQGEEKISLLKMDCEGAEYMIFRELESNISWKIMNIAMETHDGYSEKSLIDLLNKKGFIIEEYIKRTGHYRNGYCYAVFRDYLETKEEFRPVAILTSKGDGSMLCPAEFNAEESFILNNVNAPLSYSWNIDGIEIDEKNSKFDYLFSSPGVHSITCTVLNDGLTDCTSEKYIVLDNSISKTNCLAYLNRENERSIEEVNGCKDFLIKSEYFPKVWDFSCIYVSVRGVGKDISTLNGEFKCNGKTFPISERFNKFGIDTFRKDNDVSFSLKFDCNVKVELFWWAQKNGDLPNHFLEKDNQNRVVLGAMSTEWFCKVENKTQFVIPAHCLPFDWSPKVYKIGFSAVPTSMIKGSFEFNNKEMPISGWYKEVKIDAAEIIDEFVFDIYLSEKTEIKIVWWPE